MVADFFWLGFNRYLMASLCLVLLGIVPAALTWEHRPSRPTLALGGVAVALMAALNFGSARVYQSQAVWIETMVQTRPEDPTGYLLASYHAWIFDTDDEARRLLAMMPSQIPEAMTNTVTKIHLELGMVERAHAIVIEDVLVRAPDNQQALYSAFLIRERQGDWVELVAMGEKIMASPVLCREVQARYRALLLGGDVPVAQKSAIRALLEKSCTARERPQGS